MLAGLAAQTITLGPGPTALALALSAAVFILLLAAAAVFVTLAGDEMIGPVRMVGPAVRRWGGYLMMGVGVWFLVLVFLPSPIPTG